MRYLIVVDMQNDFVTGSLGSKMAEMMLSVKKYAVTRLRAALYS